jgi:hypothetical protein
MSDTAARLPLLIALCFFPRQQRRRRPRRPDTRPRQVGRRRLTPPRRRPCSLLFAICSAKPLMSDPARPSSFALCSLLFAHYYLPPQGRRFPNKEEGARFSITEDGTQTPLWCAPPPSVPPAPSAPQGGAEQEALNHPKGAVFRPPPQPHGGTSKTGTAALLFGQQPL